MSSELKFAPSYLDPKPTIDALKDRNGFVVNAVQLAQMLVVDDELSLKKGIDLVGHIRNINDDLDKLRKLGLEPYKAVVAYVNDTAKILTEALKLAQIDAQSKIDTFALTDENKRDYEASIASLFVKTRTTWEVIDRHAIPAKYLKIDEDKIDQAIKAGIRKIDGIEIKEETYTMIRRKNEQ